LEWETFSLVVYYVSGAASIAGSLTLDGGGIQIQLLLLRLMALAAAANTNVVLTNGAMLNVFC
jgi:hypothetical protein